MSSKSINREVVNLLKFLSDDGFVKVFNNKHIKVVGNFAGERKVFTLLSSPSEYYYEHQIKSQLRRLIGPLNVDKKTQRRINKVVRLYSL